MDIINLDQVARLGAALVFVLALMGGLNLVMRRFAPGGDPAARTGARRLSLVESLPLDARRRLVILRCGTREHLVILGANSETVIETGIECGQDSGNDPV